MCQSKFLRATGKIIDLFSCTPWSEGVWYRASNSEREHFKVIVVKKTCNHLDKLVSLQRRLWNDSG